MIQPFELNQAYNRVKFCTFIRSFLPEDYVENIQDLQIPEMHYAQTITAIGKCASLDNLQVLEILHSSSNDARVGIAKELFAWMQRRDVTRALVAFIPQNSQKWRFSLLEISYQWKDDTHTQKVYSNPRRHSYLLGEGGSQNTPQKYLFDMGPIAPRKEGTKKLDAWEDLQSRFSVEALTKDFYTKLYNWYLWAIEPQTGVTFPNLVSTSEDDRDDMAIKIIRLITRLLFVWFIKQKGLVPDKIFDEDELTKILKDFNPQAKDDGKYYNAILQNLFFATLNNEIGKRRFTTQPFQGKSNSFGVKNLFRDSQKESWFSISHEEVLDIFHPVPFMNCGLFECLDKYAKSDLDVENDLFLDGFSSRDSKQNGHFKYRAFIPNQLFFAEEHTETVTVEENNKTTKPTVQVMGLIPLLKLYNFTVQENTPSEMEVSLDPELLGQVFENLLAAYNPETQASARKSTGSFYTPRPIVEYMVNESLVEYLKTKVSPDLEQEFRTLISYEDKEFSLTDKQRTAVLNALYECKVLDPACGSGAFPMGMLQQMVHITRKLDSEFDPYKTKLRIINNCVYGSDIQPIAMLISKLRFFISLICEQGDDIDFSDVGNNYGINTLPNLETKFVAANSLLKADIRDYADDDWTQDPVLIKLKNDLLKIRQEHFSVRTQTSKLRKREEDRLKREEIQEYILDSTTKPNQITIQTCEARIGHLEEERKMYEGENIVEEYVDTQTCLFEEVQRKLTRKDINKIHRDKIDSEIATLRKTIEKENNKCNPVGFNAAIKQITDWNPYDQLKASPFFDPDWMFGIKEGFDIVIGNPPYVRRTSLFPDDKRKYEAIYESATEQYDLYLLFQELAIQNLKKEGVFIYINPLRFFNAEYGIGCRRLLSTQNKILFIVDVSQLPVFESAMTYPCIMAVQKSECESTHAIEYTKLDDLEWIKYVKSHSHINIRQSNIAMDNKHRFLIGTKENLDVVSSIEKHSNPLNTIYAISRGLANKLVGFSGTTYSAYKSTSIKRYQTNEQIKVDTDKAHADLFLNTMIVLPRTVKFLTAAIKPKKVICLDRIYYLTPLKKTVNDNVNLAIINSKLMNFWFELNFATSKVSGDYFDLNGDQIGSIPLQEDVPKHLLSRIESLVGKIANCGCSNKTCVYENEIDILVYLFYKLTYPEVKIIDPQIESIISEEEYNKRLAENA